MDIRDTIPCGAIVRREPLPAVTRTAGPAGPSDRMKGDSHV
jgi:hypothetical protein